MVKKSNSPVNECQLLVKNDTESSLLPSRYSSQERFQKLKNLSMKASNSLKSKNHLNLEKNRCILLLCSVISSQNILRKKSNLGYIFFLQALSSSIGGHYGISSIIFFLTHLFLCIRLLF